MGGNSKLATGICLLIGLCGYTALADDPVSRSTDDRPLLKGLEAVDDFKTQVGLFTQNPPEVWPRADINGIVTYCDPVWNIVFVQENDHAIFVYGDPVSVLEIGQRVRIQGEVRPGELLPTIFANSLEVLASDVELPQPFPILLSQISVGQYDSRRVETKGRVLQAFVEPERALLYCAEGEVRFYVAVGNLDSHAFGQEIAGAEISFTGVLAVQLLTHAFTDVEDSGREIESWKLFCPSEDLVQLFSPDEAKPANKPSSAKEKNQSIVTISELRSRDLESDRFLTHGQVRHIEKCVDHYEIVLFDEFESVRVRVESVLNLDLGMIFRVAGNLSRDEDIPLQADYLQLLDHSDLPRLHAVQLESVATQGKVDQRFRLRGVLESYTHEANGECCVLRIRDGAVDAEIRAKDAALNSFNQSSLVPGQEISVTAILVEKTNAEQGNMPLIFLANEPDAIELMPPSPLPIKTIVGFLVCLSGVVFWIWILRRQVAQRTRELQQLTANLLSSYDSIEDGILAIDRSQTVLAVNKEFRRISSLPLKAKDRSIENCTVFASGLINPVYFKEVIRLCSENERYSDSFLVEQKAPYRAIQVSTSPIEMEDSDAPIGRLWVMRDETEKRQLQKELARSNKLEALGRLAGGVAHDFNNILTAITSNLTVAQFEPARLVEEVKGELEMAQEAAFRGADVSRRLLSFSADLELALEPCSINDLIQDLARLVRHSFDASIDFQSQFDSRDLISDIERAAIEQVLMNLYFNARDAMPNGGVIATETTVVELDASRFARIIVRDSGEGIPLPVQDRIFDPFFSTKGPQGGTGLGLSTSYRVVKEHGGHLQLATTPRPGWTEFWIDLPLCNKVPKESVAEEQTTPSGARVLVVDDEEFVRIAACHILQAKGFETQEACDGSAALKFLAEHWRSIHVVLLDLAMPGIPGQQVLSEIKQRWPGLPVVICSGYVVNDLYTEEGATPDAVVSKPYRIADLIRALDQATQDVVAQKRPFQPGRTVA
ncbi:MAG: ATP-binding protein [Pirellulaceae bacterium]